MKRVFVKVAIVLVLVFLLGRYPSLVVAGLGSPELSVSIEISPSSTLEWGDTATLTVTVREIGGKDWANDVIVTPVVPEGSKIVISPSVSQPKDIDRNGFATFTFIVRVPEYEEPGTKRITINVEYGDTGAGDIGEWRYNITKYVYLTVKKPPATLIIKTTPEGASVYINDVYKGITPLSITLEEGTYDLKLKKDGYETLQETITLYPGKTTTVTRELKPLPTSLPGTSTRIEADIPSSSSSGVETMKLIGGGIIIIIGALLTVKLKKKQAIHNKESAVKAKELFPAELLKKYTPLEFLGEGGFAKVFKVKRKSDGKIVAVKIPHIDEKTSKSFIREVSSWLHLDHPNIVRLYEVDILPIPHLEMEYIEGVQYNGKTIRSLEEYPKPADDELAVKLVKGVAQGVKHAHSKGILHRDIKPLNILLKHDMTPKLTDWGLSKIGITTSSKTAAGYSPLYAAPEQLLPSKYGHTDQRTDLYQLGAVLYELLTGEPPYSGYSRDELIGKITDPDYLPKKPSDYNSNLYIFDKFFKKALAKRKEDRFSNVDEFIKALENLEKVIKERKELKETIKELKKNLSKSQLELKQSKTPKEQVTKTLEIVDLYHKLALAYCNLNSQQELLDVLINLRYYVKSEELKRDLDRAIGYLKYYISEHLLISQEFTEKLNELFSHIKAEIRGETS
ncbi:PEGA domain-containing protein [Thermococcus sp. 18S1]|uniref:protein kinase domain-containing protein n=1 Tax=Thermococcus sp. 18S1 TaxID=1638210 RepID=UPI00143989DD|nr:protein kinase [Thermococcus sp. 18S1]NJE29442.1 PEGA domain-containing protein [Thermococcus sp. 18S1]